MSARRGNLGVDYGMIEDFIEATTGHTDVTVTGVQCQPQTRSLFISYTSPDANEVDPRSEPVIQWADALDVEEKMHDDGYTGMTIDGSGKITSTSRASTRMRRLVTAWRRV